MNNNKNLSPETLDRINKYVVSRLVELGLRIEALHTENATRMAQFALPENEANKIGKLSAGLIFFIAKSLSEGTLPFSIETGPVNPEDKA